MRLVDWLLGGHHSTSDDSTRYRAASDIVFWTDGPANPLTRTRTLLETLGLWDQAQEDAVRYGSAPPPQAPATY